jgi:hypothetical protein
MYYTKVEIWTSLQASAEAEALSEPKLAELLAKARSGDPLAKGAMVRGAYHLIFQSGFAWVERSGQRRFDLIVSRLYLGVAKAIDRLIEKNNRTDVVKYINDQLRRATRSYYREESSNIFVPPSTRSSRKKEGLEPYMDLVRVGGCITATAFDSSDSGEGTGVSESSEYRGPLTTQSGKRPRVASKYRGYDECLEMVDLLDGFTEKQQEIVPLLVEDVPKRRIATETSRSLYAVRKVTTQIQTSYAGSGDVVDRIVQLAVESKAHADACCELASGEQAVVEPNGLELVLPA